MRPPLGWLVAGGALLLAASGCGAGDGTAAAVEGVSVERTTTTIPPAPKLTTSTVAPVELLPPSHLTRDEATRDWEGQRFDFGIVTAVRQVGGRWTITFDREQIRDEHGVRDGPTIVEEPILIGDDPDVTITNSNPKLRTFGVRDDVEVLRLAPTWTCEQDMPTWDRISIEELATTGAGGDQQDALSFDDTGQIARIRLSRGC